MKLPEMGHSSIYVTVSIGIFYGSTTGNTGDVAELVHKELGGAASEPVDIESTSASALAEFDVLLLGIPTWDTGNFQKDWESFAPEVGQLDLAGKKVGIFGCGDQDGYPDTFGDALGLLWETLQSTGAQLIGQWPTDGYEFNESKGVVDGKFVGVIVDFETQEDQTDERIKGWVAQIKSELGI